MIQIPLRPRTELPTEAGWYLVHEAGVGPLLLRWSKSSGRWQYPKSVATVPVSGWIGPIRGVPDEFGSIR